MRNRAVLVVGAIMLVAQPTAATEANVPSRVKHRHPIVVVKAHSNKGSAPTHLLGANHSFDVNGRGLWNPRTDAPVPAVVAGAKRAGLQALRFPGGTPANMYDWKRAIGPDRGCQTIGPRGRVDKGVAITRGLAFGPDEAMRFANMVGAKINMMVPFVNETPADAADWVEYMNGQAGAPGNPNGGVDWADVRAANGHQAPYGVRWWAIGNEQDHPHSRYWMSRHQGKALRQYAFGGSGSIRGEDLGKNCAHPVAGISSDGSATQTFEVQFPPVAAPSMRVVINGKSWKRVRSLSNAGPGARVFSLDAENGRVHFGDGVHGAIPPQGAKVHASYRSVHQGYFAFARRMKEVDPSINVCSSWGKAAFNRVARHRKYDCMAAHAIVLFSTGPGGRAKWSGPLQGHDRFMVKSESILKRIRSLKRSMPRATPLQLTEFVTMHGDRRAWPAWSTSVSHALYMASAWANWMNLRIPWGNGDAFLWAGQRGVLGGKPRYTFTADAVTREALSPMFSKGGALLASKVVRNPLRRPRVKSRGSYPALTVAATRARGAMNILVVNRLPRDAVSTRIRLDGGRSRGTANVRTVKGRAFTSWNRPGAPPSVRLHVHNRKIGARGFSYRFPAASTTVFRIPLR